jgi:hypothetical protein
MVDALGYLLYTGVFEVDVFLVTRGLRVSEASEDNTYIKL